MQKNIYYSSNLLNPKTHIKNIITAKSEAFLTAHHISINAIIVTSFVGLL